MYRATLNIGRRGVVMHAISAVDIALWDLFGKQLGIPVHDLLGGRVRPSLPAYASWLYATEDLDALAAEAAGVGGRRASAPSSSGFRTALSRGGAASAGTSSSSGPSSTRSGRMST